MIDPHVHLRDWNQAAKETLRHGLSVAWRAGLDGVFEMPNTDPPLTTRDAILRRIDDADAALPRRWASGSSTGCTRGSPRCRARSRRRCARGGSCSPAWWG